MPAALMTNGKDSFCVIKIDEAPLSFLFKLEGKEQYSFDFYRANLFEMVLDDPKPILEQPYGKLGSSVDLTGRFSSTIFSKGGRIIKRSGNNTGYINCPVYSLVGMYEYDELSSVLDGFLPETRDVPYASITTSSNAFGETGDDLYIRTLFFMTGGYGLLTEISAVAGRSIEDCCSPEYYFNSYKERLDGSNPLKRIGARDIVIGADIADWTLSVNPRIVDEFRVTEESSSSMRDLERLVDELFENLKNLEKN